MKQSITVMAILVVASFTQSFKSNNPATAKPAYNYGKFMRSMWLDSRQVKDAPRVAGFSFQIENWCDSKANINYVYYDDGWYFREILSVWNPASPITECEFFDAGDWGDLGQGDLKIGITVTGTTSNGERSLWLEDYFGNNYVCLSNVLTSGEYIIPNVWMANGMWYSLELFESCQ